jgi:hypothetical protein
MSLTRILKPAPGNKDARRNTDGIRALYEGRGQNSGSFTAASNTAVTIISAQYVSVDSSVFIQATNTAAATASPVFVSAVRNQCFDVAHPSSSNTMTFVYAFIG